MTETDNITIDVGEQQSSGPSAADQAQVTPSKVDGQEETSPTESRTTSRSGRKFNHVWLGLICGAAAMLALGLGLGLGLNNDGNSGGSAVGATAGDVPAADATIMTSTGEVQKEPSTMITPEIGGGDPQIGRNSEEDQSAKDSNDFMETETETSVTSCSYATILFHVCVRSHPSAAPHDRSDHHGWICGR